MIWIADAPTLAQLTAYLSDGHAIAFINWGHNRLGEIIGTDTPVTCCLTGSVPVSAIERDLYNSGVDHIRLSTVYQEFRPMPDDYILVPMVERWNHRITPSEATLRWLLVKV